jgi:cell division protein FtsZ
MKKTMTDITHTPSGPHFLIAHYGVDGAVATALLAQASWLQPEHGLSGNVTFTSLNHVTDIDSISQALAGIDMVFILGSDNDSTTPTSALELARQCKEKNIRCFTVLTVKKPENQMDTTTTSLRNVSNNILLLSAEKLSGDFSSCNYLKEAIATIVGPLVGKSLIGVDMEDMQSQLNHGKIIHFAAGTAQGNNRATNAAKLAIQHLPEIHQARAIIGNITFGSDFSLEEYSVVSHFLDETVRNNCTLLLCMTQDKEINEEVLVAFICVSIP